MVEESEITENHIFAENLMTGRNIHKVLLVKMLVRTINIHLRKNCVQKTKEYLTKC